VVGVGPATMHENLGTNPTFMAGSHCEYHLTFLPQIAHNSEGVI